MASAIQATCIIPLMQNDKAPEFDLQRPLTSAVAVTRAVLFSPRSFYLNFKVEGSLREPGVFVLLVGAFAGVLGAVVALASNLLFGDLDAGDVRAAVVDGLLYAVLSPVGVGVVAAVYLLSIRTFVGRVGSFSEVYRMAAYAAAALVLSWIPVLGAFAVTYALMVLMGIGIRSVYTTSVMTAAITALVGFVPVETALIWLTLAGLS